MLIDIELIAPQRCHGGWISPYLHRSVCGLASQVNPLTSSALSHLVHEVTSPQAFEGLYVPHFPMSPRLLITRLGGQPAGMFAGQIAL